MKKVIVFLVIFISLFCGVTFAGNQILSDAISILKLISGKSTDIDISNVSDINGDAKIGMEEAVNVLQNIAEGTPQILNSDGGAVNFVFTGAASVAVDLTFPAGAVPDGTAISVKEADSFPFDPDIDMISGLVFEFGPDGIIFGEPVELTITYDPSLLGSITPEDLLIYKTVVGGWEALVTTLDTTAHTLSAVMTGFTFGGAGVPADNNIPPTNTTPVHFINLGAESTASLDLSLLISALDNIAVTAYLVQWDGTLTPDATDPDWLPVTPVDYFSSTVSYTHPDDSPGLKTLYVFFKDGSGLVSEGVSDTITYTPEGPSEEVLIDFEYTLDGTWWGGGFGPMNGNEYSRVGVIFDFTQPSWSGGQGAPWIYCYIDNVNGDHHLMGNDRTSSGSLGGVINIIFTVIPSDVCFYVQFPDSVDTMLIEAFDANGQLLPGSAIGWADGYWPHYTDKSIGHDITISWPAGISEIRLHAVGHNVRVDNLRFSGGDI